MSKYKEAFKRINSVIDSHLLFSEWLQHESNWGDYIKESYFIGAELKFDDDMNIVKELVDKATPKPLIHNWGEECQSCGQIFVTHGGFKGKYCSTCGQRLE